MLSCTHCKGTGIDPEWLIGNEPCQVCGGIGYIQDCVAERDGECNHPECPQLRNRQPHCILDQEETHKD